VWITGRLRARHRRRLENEAKVKDNLVRFRGKMSRTATIGGVNISGARIIKVKCWESEVDVKPGSNAVWAKTESKGGVGTVRER
jgi:hypothetical protein